VASLVVSLPLRIVDLMNPLPLFSQLLAEEGEGGGESTNQRSGVEDQRPGNHHRRQMAGAAKTPKNMSITTFE
jgi:hypothetical protein